MRYLLSLVVVATAFISCGNKQTTTDAATATDTITQPVVYENDYLVKVGDTAPDFTLPLTDGTTFTLSQQRGKLVMLQFTASWCGVCRREMPHIERIYGNTTRITKSLCLWVSTGRRARGGG